MELGSQKSQCNNLKHCQIVGAYWLVASGSVLMIIKEQAKVQWYYSKIIVKNLREEIPVRLTTDLGSVIDLNFGKIASSLIEYEKKFLNRKEVI